MAGFGTPPRAGQVLTHGRLQRMQQGAFIETSSQGLFTGEILASATPMSPNTFTDCRWMRTGQMLTYWSTNVLPAGIDTGDGLYAFTVPAPPNQEYVRVHSTNDHGHRFGDGRLRDDSGGGSLSEVVVAQFRNDDDGVHVQLARSGSNAIVTDDNPFTFAADDAIAFKMRYPADPRALP